MVGSSETNRNSLLIVAWEVDLSIRVMPVDVVDSLSEIGYARLSWSDFCNLNHSHNNVERLNPDEAANEPIGQARCCLGMMTPL